MLRFEIVFSEQAKTDIQNLSEAIMYEYEAPLTAFIIPCRVCWTKLKS